MKSGKLWGTTEEIIANEHFELHRIDIMSGGYCSKHCHDYKYNMFMVERGRLQVEIWKKSGTVDFTVLNTGDKMIVEPKQYHRFKALDDTIAYEAYWVKLYHNDIIRETFGGYNGTNNTTSNSK